MPTRSLEVLSNSLSGVSILNGSAFVGSLGLPNPGSVALHEKLGFEKIAHLKEVGWRFEQWLDVGYWELILNH